MRLIQLLRDRWAPYAPDSLGANYVKISRAIYRRREVSARLGREAIVFCPHALGFRRAEPYVLALTAPAPSGPEVSGPGWRWVAVADLRDVRLQGHFWSAAPPLPSFGDFEIAMKVA